MADGRGDEFNLENGLVLVGIDPGTHTGVAVAYKGFNPVADSFMVVAASGRVADEFVAVQQIVTVLLNTFERLEAQFGGSASVVVAIEDFVLRQDAAGRSTVKSSKREGLSPARIGAMLYMALEGVVEAVTFQMPGEMSALTNRRLLARGLWVPDGRAGGAPVGTTAEHRRDALRHVAVLANKQGILLGEWLKP